MVVSPAIVNAQIALAAISNLIVAVYPVRVGAIVHVAHTNKAVSISMREFCSTVVVAVAAVIIG
jgi:hypothetical protein